MPKKKPAAKPAAATNKARDAALTNMLRTPPRKHKDEPKRGWKKPAARD